MSNELHFDFDRSRRLGFSEAVLCSDKSPAQIENILSVVNANTTSVLLTRLSEEQFAAVSPELHDALDYDPTSGTAFFGKVDSPRHDTSIAIVSAGTSDARVAAEARRTLEFHGCRADMICDIGVAGLWRISKYVDQLAEYKTIIVVAGMDGALPSVIGGLFGSLIVAVPTSTGYGAAKGGETALHAALASCAPGLVVVNIDNGYGAAIAAMRATRMCKEKER